MWRRTSEGRVSKGPLIEDIIATEEAVSIVNMWEFES
jgi:hypothetical protein